MSIIVRYSSGSTFTISANKVNVEKVQELGGQYHVPYSSMVGMVRLGLGIQKITVTGDTLDMTACVWHDVVAISLDSGTSYQTVYFSGVPYTSDCWSGIYPYSLELLASPLREGAAVRYPASGYKFGNQSITGISQAGNVNAYPIIHYLAPLFYAPLSNTLIDFAGQSVTFTRTASKTHNGVVYPINTPIFDNGLYVASDTAQDVATWTPPASTVRTVAMQIKMTRPITGTNLVTNGEFEANTTGWSATNATLSRETGAPLVGTGSLKLLVTANGTAFAYFSVATTVGHVYRVTCIARTSAGRLSYLRCWDGTIGASVDCAATAVLSVTFTATATSHLVAPTIVSALANEIMYVDSVVCVDLTALFGSNVLYIWTRTYNKLAINIATGVLTWTDDTLAVSATFQTDAYLGGELTAITVLDNTSHAVTVVTHQAGGAYYTATGTLGNLSWQQSTLGNLEGSIAHLVQYPYILTSTEYQAIAFSSLSLLYNTLYVGNRYAGEIVKGSDKRLANAAGSDISALLGGVDIPIGSAAVTIAQTQGLSARWYVEVKRTDV